MRSAPGPRRTASWARLRCRAGRSPRRGARAGPRRCFPPHSCALPARAGGCLSAAAVDRGRTQTAVALAFSGAFHRHLAWLGGSRDSGAGIAVPGTLMLADKQCRCRQKTARRRAECWTHCRRPPGRRETRPARRICCIPPRRPLLLPVPGRRAHTSEQKVQKRLSVRQTCFWLRGLPPVRPGSLACLPAPPNGECLCALSMEERTVLTLARVSRALRPASGLHFSGTDVKLLLIDRQTQ